MASQMVPKDTSTRAAALCSIVAQRLAAPAGVLIVGRTARAHEPSRPACRDTEPARVIPRPFGQSRALIPNGRVRLRGPTACRNVAGLEDEQPRPAERTTGGCG